MTGSFDSFSEPDQPQTLEQVRTEPVSALGQRAHPASIGPYKVLRFIAEGGMASVYLAEQTRPIHRQVAIKLLAMRPESRRGVRRFRAELQALARMQHPHIAQVFEAGETEAGQPYIVMEYVPGLPITDYCDQHHLNIEARLRLFLTLCEAVQHAHQKAIIHRDLKPSNVLVTEEQGEALLKVIDFGIAKSLGEPLTDETLHTGGLIGTPPYMSPEAISSSVGHDVDTRTDVYALGMLLYQLLVGSLPFGGRGENLLRTIRRILEEEALQPSALLRQQDATTRTVTAGGRSTDWASLVRHLRGDLDWIVTRAIEKDPDRRYASAAELAADVRRHLNFQPIAAGPPGLLYRTAKFVRRNVTAVAAGLLVLAALVGGIIATSLEARRATREAQRANHEAEVARQVSEFLVSLFKVSNPSEAQGRSISARELLDRGAQKVRRDLAGQPLTQAQMMATMGTVYVQLGEFPEAEPLLREALEIRRREAGDNSLEVADSLHQLGVLCVESGRLEEAEQLLQQEVDLLLKQPDATPLARARALNSLAATRGASGRPEEAAPLLEQAAAMFEQAEGADSADLATTLANLAAVRSNQGRAKEAEALIRRVLAIRERVLGPDHPHVAFALTGLGAQLNREGKPEDALAMQQRALSILERAQGPEHPDVAFVLGNLGVVYQSLSRYTEAETALRRTVAIYERVLGPDHIRLVGYLANLAETTSALGKTEEAEQLWQRCLAIVEQKRGADSPQLLLPLRGYAELLRKLDRGAEAEALEQRAAAIEAKGS